MADLGDEHRPLDHSRHTPATPSQRRSKLQQKKIIDDTLKFCSVQRHGPGEAEAQPADPD